MEYLDEFDESEKWLSRIFCFLSRSSSLCCVFLFFSFLFRLFFFFLCLFLCLFFFSSILLYTASFGRNSCLSGCS